MNLQTSLYSSLASGQHLNIFGHPDDKTLYKVSRVVNEYYFL